MNKQILIVKGSPRKNGNTAAMAASFAKGASESGNIITEIGLKKIKSSETVWGVAHVRNRTVPVPRKMI